MSVKIGLMGKMRTGKDTVADYLVAKHGYTEYKFSKGIKEIYAKYNYEPDAVKPREKLINIGQSIRESLGQNVWVNYTLSTISEDTIPVISDVRQDNEIDKLKELGFILIAIEVSPETQAERLKMLGEVVTEDISNHETEQISVEKADFIVENNGTIEELHIKIDEILKNLK